MDSAPTFASPPASALQETGARGFEDGLNTARETWVRAGLDVARFDEAAGKSGLSPTPPVPEDVTKAYSEFNSPVSPVPEQYYVNYGKYGESRTPDQLTAVNSELTNWAAEMGFSPSMGSQVIELLVDLGQRFKAMPPAAREDWAQEQDRLALRLAGGSETVLAETRQRAQAALGSAKSSVSRDLAALAVPLKDAFIMTLLANHTKTLELFDAKNPGMRKR
jgi:hypothetical protein